MRHFLACMIPISSPPHCRALRALQISFPEALKNGTFDHCLEVRIALDSSAASSLFNHCSTPLTTDGTFHSSTNYIFLLQTQDDPVARNYLRQLLDNLAAPWVEAPQPGPGPAAGGAPHAGPSSSQAGPSCVRR
jgi:hypothetical protein